MAVLTTVQPVILPRVAVDKRFPIGLWYAFSTIAGDASGGSAQLQVQWPTANPDLIFTVEEFTYESNANTSANIICRINTRMLFRGTTDYEYATVILASGSAGAAKASGRAVGPSSLYFKPSGAQWDVTMEVTNAAAVTFRMGCYGVVYDARGLMMPGFPGAYYTRAVTPVELLP